MWSLPERIDKEGLHHRLLIHRNRIDGIHQIGIVHHDLRRLLGKLLAVRIYHVEKTRIGQILGIVHYRSAAGINLMSQLTDIGRMNPVKRQQIEKFLYFGEVFQLNLLDEQDVHFRHHVHCLEQVFREVSVLKEERIEAMMQIVVEILDRTEFWQYLLYDVFVVVDNFFQAVGTEACSRHQIDIFLEGEALEIIEREYIADGWIIRLESHHARSCEDKLQLRIEIVALAQFCAPVRLLEYPGPAVALPHPA